MLGLCLLSLSATPLLVPQEEVVQDFRKYFRRTKETWERVEYIQALRGIDEAEVAEVLLPVLRDKDPLVVQAARQVLADLPSAEARAPLLLPLTKGKPKEALPALLRAAGEGPWPEAKEAVREHLEHKKSDARLWAAWTAGRLQDSLAIPLLGELATRDKEVPVRVAAVDSLRLFGNGRRAEIELFVVTALADEDMSVVATACRAAQEVRLAGTVPELIRLLEEGGRLMQNAYPALRAITDMEYDDSASRWRGWWDRAAATWSMPSDEDVAKRMALREAEDVDYRTKNAETTFAGVPTPSRSLIFVIDISGSMEEFVIDREHFRKLGFTRFEKIEIVREEVRKAVQVLGPEVKFNILAFASEIFPWRKKLAQSNSLNRRSALAFLNDLEPLGGARSAELASAGLGGAAALEAGRTNTFGALCAALGVKPEEAATPRATTPSKGTEALGAGVDTIFLLTDGIPSTGQLTDTDDILDAVTELNRFRGVVIHAIAIGEFRKSFMIRLARQNGGEFSDLGK